MPPVTKSKTKADAKSDAKVEAPAPSNNAPTGEILYPQLHIWGVPLDDPKGKRIKFNPVTSLTFAQAKKIIGWETETEYSTKQAALNPGTKPEDKGNELGPLALFEDPITGEKVWCKFNGTNRPFDMAYTLRYLQDMLNRRWAGTLGVAYDTVNGETFIVGNRGNVISAQKRIIAFNFLCEIWHNASHKLNGRAREMWPEEPTLPVIIVFGVSEHPDILRTLDNVQPRSESDVVYTSGMFDAVKVDLGVKDAGGNPKLRDLWPLEKKELSKMMARATDMLWKRTAVAENIFLKYQTHGESIDFMDRHPNLRKCVVHLFHENGTRVTYEDREGGKKRKIQLRGISELRVSPGDVAALMFMMATSGGSAQKYNLSDRNKRQEDMLDFSRYDKAADFIRLLADRGSTVGSAIRDVRRPQVNRPPNEYGARMFSNQEGGTREERLAVIGKAWLFWIAGEEVDAEMLKLGYNFKPKDQPLAVEFELAEKIKVGGIDMGEPEKEKSDDKANADAGTTNYTEAPSADDEVWDGDDDEGQMDEEVEELRAEREATNPVEESADEEKARRAQVEAEAEETHKKRVIKRKP